MNPRVWLAKVSAIIPEYGYHIYWYSLWMEEARGIPMRSLYKFWRNRVVKDEADRYAVDLIQRMNSTQVMSACVCAGG